jgi:hypothetical protein
MFETRSACLYPMPNNSNGLEQRFLNLISDPLQPELVAWTFILLLTVDSMTKLLTPIDYVRTKRGTIL